MKTAKRFLATIMVLAMMLTMLGSLAVSAASTDELVIEVVDGQLVVYLNGEEFKTFDLEDASGIKLSRSAKTDKIVVSFTDASGKARNIALADDATVSLQGDLGNVTLNKSLGDLPVTIAEDAKVATLKVGNSGNVEVAGSVAKVDIVTKAADVSIAATAKVDEVTAPKGVALTGDGAANVTVNEKAGATPTPTTAPVNPNPNPTYNWQDIGGGSSGGYYPPTPPNVSVGNFYRATKTTTANGVVTTSVKYLTANGTFSENIAEIAPVADAKYVSAPEGYTLDKAAPYSGTIQQIKYLD